MTNKLDRIYRSLRLTKYFVNGWGNPENLKRICEFQKIVSNRKTCYALVSPDHPVQIDKEQNGKDCIIINGYFITPMMKYMPEVVPAECEKAYFQLVLPKQWSHCSFKPVVLHIAGTGDQYFWRRRNFIAKPLIKEAGIGSIILENPFYGLRKPKQQTMSILQNVSDVFVMGGCLMLETLVLFHFSERIGLGPLGITGLSMGGHMASISATSWPKPLVVVPCLSGLTASYVFTQGVVSHALDWKLLGKQYVSNDCLKNEIQKMINITKKDVFKAGQQFVRDFSENTKAYEFCNLHQVNIPQINSDKVTAAFGAINDDEKTDVTLCKISSATVENKNIYEDKTCDNYINFGIDCTNKFNSSSITKFTAKENYISNTEASVKMDYTSKLLNLIVKLTRASINRNILLKKTKDKFERMKQTGTCTTEQQALNFMNVIMDECTHLKNYPILVDTSLAIAVCADDDAYIPLQGKTKLNDVWPGAEVRFVKGGHVRAYVQHQKEFRLAIIDAFERCRSKYFKEISNS